MPRTDRQVTRGGCREVDVNSWQISQAPRVLRRRKILNGVRHWLWQWHVPPLGGVFTSDRCGKWHRRYVSGLKSCPIRRCRKTSVFEVDQKVPRESLGVLAPIQQKETLHFPPWSRVRVDSQPLSSPAKLFSCFCLCVWNYPGCRLVCHGSVTARRQNMEQRDISEWLKPLICFGDGQKIVGAQVISVLQQRPCCCYCLGKKTIIEADVIVWVESHLLTS